MCNKFIFALLSFLFLATLAQAQNPTCPTRPVGDSSNACASTGFVHSAVTTNCTPFTATVGGCVPPSGGGTMNFLRADGSFASVGFNPIDVWLVIGDSNAVGEGSSASSPTPPATAVMYCANGTIVTAADPTCNAVTSAQNANTGSEWPATAIAYGRPIGFVLTGVVGSTQASACDFGVGNGNWQATGAGTNYTNALTAINTALTAYAAAGYTPVFRGIIVSLGGNDGTQINNSVCTSAQYTAAYTAMAANWRAATIGGKVYPNLAIYQMQAGTLQGGNDAGYSQIRSAQVAIAAADGNTLLIDTQLASFGPRGLLQTAQQHPTQAGYNLMGASIGASLVPNVPPTLPWLQLNGNAAAPPLPFPGTILQLNGLDDFSGNGATLELNNFKNGGTGVGSIAIRDAAGTGASPTATQSGSLMGVLSFRGYGATGYSATNNGLFACIATQNFTDSAHGTQCAVYTTPNSSATPAQAILWDQDKTVTMFAYGAGIAHFSSGGKLSSSAVSLTADVSGTLPVANGGTGITTGAAQWLSPPISVNFGTAGDNTISIPLPSGFTRICVAQLLISGPSGSLTAATFGLFTASGGGGTAMIASGTAITVSTATDNAANNAEQINTANFATGSYLPTSNQVFFRVGSTAAQTANVQLAYRPCP